MKKQIVLTAVFCSALNVMNAWGAQAPLQINDPAGVLEQSDLFVGHPTFESTFGCGAQATYEVNDCDLNGNVVVCRPPVQVTEQVSDCSADSVTLRGDGPTSRDWVIARADFEAANGNLLRSNLATLISGPQDFIDIDSGQMGFYRLPDGSGVKSFAVRMMVHVFAQGPNGEVHLQLPLEVAVGQDVPGVASLLWSSLVGIASPPGFRLLSY